MVDKLRYGSVREAAERLAALNADSEENIGEIYWFPDPDENQIRLIEVDATALPSEGRAAAYYFGPDPLEEIPLPSGIALIRPEEVRIIEPPGGWPGWDHAVKIWPPEDNGK